MEMLDLEWERCLDGYHLEEMKPLTASEEEYFKASPWIDRTYRSSPLIMRNSFRMERYRPLNNPVFAIFAKWEASPEGMVRFCNAYGPLMGMDPVDWMLDQQLILHNTISALEAGDPFQLVVQLKWGDCSTCRLTLQQSGPGQFVPALIPQSLGHAMHVQLALNVASGAKLWSCEHCGIPFFVGTGTKRRNTAKYCSNACKVAAYKKRYQATEQLKRGTNTQQ
jgi:hypothetical protein